MNASARTRPAVLWVAALAVVVVAAVVAIVASRGGDDATPVAGQTGSVQVGATSSTAPGEEGTDAVEAAAPSDALPPYDATAADPAVGTTIPTVTGTDFDGNEITIAPDGTAKVIVFVAHWCPHCQREVPLLKRHLDDHPMPDDVQLLTVSTSVHPGADNYPPQEWLAREGWSAPVIADDEVGSVAQQFGLTSFPYFVVVGADGKVVERASGEISTEQFDAAVAAAQRGAAG